MGNGVDMDVVKRTYGVALYKLMFNSVDTDVVKRRHLVDGVLVDYTSLNNYF